MRPTLALGFLLLIASPAPSGDGWTTVDYGALVDRAARTHSGESVGALLDRWRAHPDDPLAPRLLDPHLEPYAFVLADALDANGPAHDPPLVDLGGLWPQGGSEPAWVELLRSRRYVVESDAKGHVRVFAPLPDDEETPADAAAASHAAFDAAWPVLRHVLAAERRRVGRPLEVEAHAFRHRRRDTAFDLAVASWNQTVDAFAPKEGTPPFDVAELERLLGAPARIEGGRLARDGAITWLTAKAPAPASFLGRAMTLGDVAVAYRAVFHGGLAEPYMSLDRGASPWMAAVNYGGRLRDTTLGLASMLSDVRFKTFSLGIDPIVPEDARARLRKLLPGFRTHLERFAADPSSAGIGAQQTRFWFYPDDVEVALSERADAFAFVSHEMAAASERISGAKSEDPPWTKATVAFLDEHHDELAGAFPELAALDEEARLLTIFTWLKTAEEAGAALPDLDALLDVAIPAEPTPRTFPQLLTWNALPPAGGKEEVVVVDQAEVGKALERLQPRIGELPLADRLRRASTWLDPKAPDQRAAAAAVEAALAGGGGADGGESAAFEAERLAMHGLVLTTPSPEARAAVDARRAAGEAVRVFSVAIGGIDLGMSATFRRATRRPGALLAASRAPSRRAASAEPAAPRAAPPARAPQPRGAGPVVPSRESSVRTIDGAVVTGADGPDVRALRRVAGKGGTIFERVEGGRFLAYRFDGTRAVVVPPSGSGPARVEPGEPPEGLALLTVDDASPQAVALRVYRAGNPALAATFPRRVLQRLVLGKAFDPSNARPVPGFEPAASVLGGARALMILEPPGATSPPWQGPASVVPGDEDPVRLAAALSTRWGEEGAAVVGTSPSASPKRWNLAPPAGPARVLAPEDAFPGTRAAWRLLVPESTGGADARVVVLVSAESPDVLARRLRSLAADPSMKGRHLAVVALGGAQRHDLPAGLVAEGSVAGLGWLEAEPWAVSRTLDEVRAFLGRLASAKPGTRIETVPGPFVWIY